MDNNQKQISRLYVICKNVVTHRPYVAFAESYSDKMRINSFKKNAAIIMNNETLEPAPLDGIIVKGENVKLAVVYQKDIQKFKVYYQE